MYALIPVLLLSVGSVGLAPRVAATTNIANSSAGFIIPLYIYPGAAWTEVEQVKSSNPTVPMTVIINPGNGPGPYYDVNYGAGVNQMRADGINVIGYVYTDYATRSLSSVESDIANFKQLYNVNGIFLDQMSNIPGEEGYYSAATAYAHSLGLNLVVGNPGTSVPSSFFGTVDVIVIYENSGLPSQSTLASATAGGSPSEFADISYGLSSITQSEVSSLASYVSGIYLTDGVMPDPYYALASYLSAEATELAASHGPITEPLTVQSVDLSGNPIVGMWTTISANGAVVDQGFTPLTYTATVGVQYTVTSYNYRNIIFNHWQDGTTAQSTTVSLTQPTTLVESYSTTTTISVSSVTTSGSSLSGMWTVIYNGQGSVIQTGFTPLSYTATYGSTYTVCMGNYQNIVFSNWQNGSSSPCETLTLSQSAQLVATYNT